jgi:hypothetical protein
MSWCKIWLIMLARLMLPSALLLGLLLPAKSVPAQQGGPGRISAIATLSILKHPVSHVPAGGNIVQGASDGMNLAVGDRIVTGPQGTALITFLDGSTLTVEPGSDVVIRTADASAGKRSNITIRIYLGRVWARVVRLADPGSSFSLESNTATATVHDGLIGGQQNPDDSFTCWTRAGELTVKDGRGQTLVVLGPGQRTLVKAGTTPSPVPFAVHQSALRIMSSPGVMPLIQMPDETLVAGFVAPGAEVNQVFGSFTGAAPDGTYTVEVPAGEPGPFLLVLEGQHDGPLKVKVTGHFKGDPVYQQELSRTIKKGERLSTEITQQMDAATAGDPKTAKILSGQAGSLKPLSGSLPGKILPSPVELLKTDEGT